MSSSFAYSNTFSPLRSPLQKKFDDERKHKERLFEIQEKNKECQIRRQWLEKTFKEAIGHIHEQKKSEPENDNSPSHSNESNAQEDEPSLNNDINNNNDVTENS